LGCALVAGCADCTFPRIDPSGRRIFVQDPPPPTAAAAPRPTDFEDEPGGKLCWDDVGVTIGPQSLIAPVGSEVVLVAGVRGPDRYLMTNRRLEWSLAQGSVGSFVDIGKGGFCDWLMNEFDTPQKINGSYAIGYTLRDNVRLNRGTCDPGRNVEVLAGQGWISLTSPVEGTSHVTVLAPSVYAWDARVRSASVQWVDVECRFPPPAVNPAGTKHAFTTAVTRRSDKSPCVGWRVRYTLAAGGPAAGFSPDGAQSVEVVTDQAGQATAEIFQKQPAPGNNSISIEVLRPAAAGGPSAIVGQGSTVKTWTAAALSVRKSGPSAAGLGSTLTYRIEVYNPGDQVARDVLVSEEIPDGLTYVGSNPQAEKVGQRLQWRIAQLGAYVRSAIDVSYRADKQGSVTVCADATAAGGLKASNCATTTIGAAGTATAGGTLSVTTSGPSQVKVGDEVTFTIQITNRGSTPATNLTIRDEFDAGLTHAQGPGPMTFAFGDLAAGATSPAYSITFRAAKAGKLCHRVTVTGTGGIVAKDEACVTAVGPGGAVEPGPTPGPTPAESTKGLSATIKKLGAKEQAVKDLAEFLVTIANTTNKEMKNVRVVVQHDASLDPEAATKGNTPQGNSLVWVLDSLHPGRPVELQMNCRCLTAAEKACCRVSATTLDGAIAKDEACLKIRTGAGGGVPGGQSALTMTLADLRDPVTLGKETTYEIQVLNQGSAADQLVVLTVTLPEGMTVVRLGTTGPPGTKYNVQGQKVIFDPVEKLGPGEPLSYRVRVLAKKLGQVRTRAELTSLNQPQPQVKEETTDVVQ
jgi:uncharacterized repeat protein (TIGR01451 family)